MRIERVLEFATIASFSSAAKYPWGKNMNHRHTKEKLETENLQKTQHKAFFFSSQLNEKQFSCFIFL